MFISEKPPQLSSSRYSSTESLSKQGVGIQWFRRMSYLQPFSLASWVELPQDISRLLLVMLCRSPGTWLFESPVGIVPCVEGEGVGVGMKRKKTRPHTNDVITITSTWDRRKPRRGTWCFGELGSSAVGSSEYFKKGWYSGVEGILGVELHAAAAMVGWCTKVETHGITRETLKFYSGAGIIRAPDPVGAFPHDGCAHSRLLQVLFWITPLYNPFPDHACDVVSSEYLYLELSLMFHRGDESIGVFCLRD